MKDFEEVVKQDNIIINMNVPLKPETLPEYLEGWRRKIWDQGFLAHLRGAKYFKKSDNFDTYEGSEQAVRRVLFRYVFNCSAEIFIWKLQIECLNPLSIGEEHIVEQERYRIGK